MTQSHQERPYRTVTHSTRGSMSPGRFPEHEATIGRQLYEDFVGVYCECIYWGQVLEGPEESEAEPATVTRPQGWLPPY